MRFTLREGNSHIIFLIADTSLLVRKNAEVSDDQLSNSFKFDTAFLGYARLKARGPFIISLSDVEKKTRATCMLNLPLDTEITSTKQTVH